MADGSSPFVSPPGLPPFFPPKSQRPEPPPKPVRYVEARWLTDGMAGYIRWNRDAATGGVNLLRVTVVCAAGHHGRCVNERRGYDCWKRLDDILVPDTEPQAKLPDMVQIAAVLDRG